MADLVRCPNCGKMVASTATKCLHCGGYINLENQKSLEINKQLLGVVGKDIDKVLITSTNSFEIYRISEYKGHISTEVCVPNGLLGMFTAGTFFTVDALSRAKLMVKNEICKLAILQEANAIVGFDIDISALNGGVVVSANGTAVIIDNYDFKPQLSQYREYANEMSKTSYSAPRMVLNESATMRREKWQCPKCKRMNSENNSICYFCNSVAP